MRAFLIRQNSVSELAIVATLYDAYPTVSLRLFQTVFNIISDLVHQYNLLLVDFSYIFCKSMLP